MKSLFKYIDKKYSDAFFKEGSIKIGSLHEYQDVEFYGGVIGDAEEGMEEMVTRFKDNDDHSRYYEEKNKLDKSDKPDLSNVTVTSVKLVAILSESEKGLISTTFADNCYIYCTTKEFNAGVMKEFGCDSCIEIIDPNKFFEEISVAISDMGKFVGVMDVVYKNRLSHYSDRNTVPKVLLKSPRYMKQKEVRAIWEPNEKIEGPLYVSVPKAIRYCRLFEDM